MHKLRDAPSDSEADLKARLEEIVGKKKLFVLGLGNTDRADDGAGVLIAESLKKPFPGFSFSEHDGVEGTVLDISERKSSAVVLFVDAADLKIDPGSIRVIMKEDIRETEITTHRVAVALMASILKTHGKTCHVICIQPKTISFQGEVSPQVKESIDILSRTLAAIMARVD